MKKLIALVVALLMGTVFSASVSAVSLPDNQSPFSFGPVNFKGGIPFVYDLTPGSKMTNVMRVHNFSDKEISLKLEVSLPGGETGDLGWFSLSKSEITIAEQSYEDVAFDIVVTADSVIGSTKKALVSATMLPVEEEAGAVVEGIAEDSGVQIDIATAYAKTFKVNVASGEAVVVDETPVEESLQVWPFIKENINTILLVLIFALVAKIACCGGKRKK